LFLYADHLVQVGESLFQVLAEETGDGRACTGRTHCQEKVLPPHDRRDKDVPTLPLGIIEKDPRPPACLAYPVVQSGIRSGGNSTEYTFKQGGEGLVRDPVEFDRDPRDGKIHECRRKRP